MKIRSHDLFKTVAIVALICSCNGLALAGDTCPQTVDPAQFSSAEQLRELTKTVAGFGLRSTGSAAHENNISWIASEFSKLPGFTTKEDYIEIQRWQPTPLADDGVGRSLEKAGHVTLVRADGGTEEIKVAGAVPYSLPTNGQRSTGELVYFKDPNDINKDTAKGKVVIIDVPETGLPYAGLLALSRYFTDDLWSESFSSYNRPFMWSDAKLAKVLTDAGIAGAAGVIVAFDVPRAQVAGYFDPHRGTHFTVPAAYVGIDEALVLKAQAEQRGKASIGVDAVRDTARTRNLIATLPGLSKEKIIFNANTDGNTWVQENANAGLMAVADYFSRLPLACRPRTLEFAFGSAHLHISREGTAKYAAEVNRDYDKGEAVFAFAVEHLGTREIVPVERTDGPGRELQLTGKGEVMAWFTGPSEALKSASVKAIKKHNLDRVAVLRGQDNPNPMRSPTFCSFGGIGSYFHGNLIPTIAIISGPWSLWAPSFGEQAVDFDRMRNQLMAVTDTTLELAGKPASEIAGDYTAERKRRAEGAETCEFENPPEQAPSAE
ncbi:hypothetical protein [Pseudomonas sp. GV071]|jgi:hypothetical protein|uniref:hypothetical protein n=1 Tax=Pseudomonas sp. GV071 TaxID=2135754 RepID=UPI000D35A38C|nr:hypothetical protein [Pseudomonas sp. GV071]PTQ74341.1 hypothetical protein C8K61_101781 [Pseudomonas sp. GV071]